MTAAKHEQDATTATPRFLDWDRIADSPDFKALVAARRRFVTFWLVFWVALFFAWAVLTIFADDFMSSSFYDP